MTYKTHLSTGLLFSAAFFLFVIKTKLFPALIVLIVLSTVLGSSAPDLDSPTSTFWHRLPAGSILGRIVHPVFIGGHRHLSHSLLGMALFCGLFYLLLHLLPLNSLFMIQNFTLLAAFGLGYFSHLFADMFTESGIPIFFPAAYHFGIPPDPFEKVRIKTGHWFENLIVYPAVNISLVLLILDYLKH